VGGALGRLVVLRTAYRIAGIPGGMRPFGSCRHGCEDIVKLDLEGMLCEYVDWIHMSQNRIKWRVLANTVMNLWAPKKGERFLNHLSQY
jgi:hypothetical protein